MKYNLKCMIMIFLLLVIVICCLGKPVRENLENGDHTHDNNDLNREFSNYRDMYDNRNGEDNDTAYYNTEQDGISESEMANVNRDLYILKSSTVPPVCTKSPYNEELKKHKEVNSDDGKCPPCPACARCPEPAFECKKVPNYNSTNNSFLPRPLLNDFSQF